MREFGSLAKVTAAKRRRLERVVADEPHVARAIGAHRAAVLHTLRERVAERPVLAGSSDVVTYLRALMGGSNLESLRVLYLDASNGLLRDELAGEGTVDRVPFYPRRILERAFELGAVSLILAHNHPGGDPSPSLLDLRRTGRFARTCRDLGIELHDHLIVCEQGVTSLRSLGAMDRVG